MYWVDQKVHSTFHTSVQKNRMNFSQLHVIKEVKSSLKLLESCRIFCLMSRGSCALLQRSASSSLSSGNWFTVHSSLSNLLLIPLLWYLAVLEFFQLPYLETKYPLYHLPHPQYSWFSFDCSAVNHVKSCTASGHSFSSREFCLFQGLMAFTAFSITMMTSSVV